jgi:hypothetical protein
MHVVIRPKVEILTSIKELRWLNDNFNQHELTKFEISQESQQSFLEASSLTRNIDEHNIIQQHKKEENNKIHTSLT